MHLTSPMLLFLADPELRHANLFVAFQTLKQWTGLVNNHQYKLIIWLFWSEYKRLIKMG